MITFFPLFKKANKRINYTYRTKLTLMNHKVPGVHKVFRVPKVLRVKKAEGRSFSVGIDLKKL